MLNNIFLRSLFLIIIGFYNCAAAQTQNYNPAEVKALYELMQFDKAVSKGQSLLSSTHDFYPDQLIILHQYIGLSFYNLDKADSAKVHFLTLLSINPDYQLDPIQTSPKIIDFFNKIKFYYQQMNKDEKQLSYCKYIFIEDPRPSAVWRSAILPGWGQYYKKQERKGKIFGISFISSGLLAVGSYLIEDSYHQDYLHSKEQSQIDKYYDKYNQWHKTRKVLTYTSAGIWIASVFDALWGSYRNTHLSVTLDNNNSLLCLSVQF